MVKEWEQNEVVKFVNDDNRLMLFIVWPLQKFLESGLCAVKLRSDGVFADIENLPDRSITQLLLKLQPQ